MKKFGYLAALCYKTCDSTDYIQVHPTHIVRCNLQDNFFDVENMGSYMSAFLNDDDVTYPMAEFAISWEDFQKKFQLNEKSDDQDLEMAFNRYLDELNHNLYFQKIDYIQDIATTYSLCLEENKVSVIAVANNMGDIHYMNEETNLNFQDFRNPSDKEELVYSDEEKKETKDEASKDEKQTTLLSSLPGYADFYRYLTHYIKGQDEAIQMVLATLYRHFQLQNYRNKTNMMIIGPSGCGKTEILRRIQEKISIPMVTVDSSFYSAAGYEGNSLSDILVQLYHQAGDNLEKAEHGIVVIDEIDKKVTKDQNDVSGIRVLNSLLTMIEGGTFHINIGSEGFPHYIQFCTNQVLFITIGAFAELAQELQRKSSSLGFQATPSVPRTEITLEDLNHFGLPLEYLRRIRLCQIHPLSMQNLYDILVLPEDSCLYEYQRAFEKWGFHLQIDPSALWEFVRRAAEEKQGASGLKVALANVIDPAFHELCMSDGSWDSVYIDETTMQMKPPYRLIKKKED